MKTKTIIVIVIVAIIFFCVIVGLIIAENYQRQENVDDLLWQAIEQKKGKQESVVFEMNSLTTFPWDGLYIFPRNTKITQINDTLGFSWNDFLEHNINMEDDNALLVFTKGDQVVKYILFPGIRGKFEETLHFKKLSPKEAVFMVLEPVDGVFFIKKYEGEISIKKQAKIESNAAGLFREFFEEIIRKIKE